MWVRFPPRSLSHYRETLIGEATVDVEMGLMSAKAARETVDKLHSSVGFELKRAVTERILESVDLGLNCCDLADLLPTCHNCERLTEWLTTKPLGYTVSHIQPPHPKDGDGKHSFIVSW